MPKVKKKTRKSIASRCKVTANGKLKGGHAGKNHLLTKKSAKRKRRLSKIDVVTATQAKKYKQLIGA